MERSACAIEPGESYPGSWVTFSSHLGIAEVDTSAERLPLNDRAVGTDPKRVVLVLL